MNLNEFQTEMRRLIPVFGEKHYHAERVKLIWEEFKFVPIHTWKKVINELIVSSIRAPLASDFRLAVAKFKEQNYKHQVKANSAIAPLPEETVALMMTISDRIANRISEKDWADFIRIMGEIKPTHKCNPCQDEGWVFVTENNVEVVYNCSCSIGQARTECFPKYVSKSTP